MKSDIMIKYEADSKTTPQNIRDIERYLVGGVRRYNNPVKTEDIIKKYHLELDEIVPSSSTGDSETVYEILCKNFTQANAYHDFMEIYEAMKNKEPLRTELLPEKKTRSYKNCKAKFHEGEEVYCVELVENIYKAFRAKVIGYRIIKLSDGNFDIEYDLKAPCYGLGIGNKLQRNGTIFRTKSEAEQKAVERNLAMGWVA